MGKFRKEGKKEVPQVSTSSLPDIVYMLIFFFMITTTMRDVELKVKTAMPKASEIQKLEHKALVSSIYIGPPRDTKLGTESRIQLDDSFARVTDIADWIQKERATVFIPFASNTLPSTSPALMTRASFLLANFAKTFGPSAISFEKT